MKRDSKGIIAKANGKTAAQELARLVRVYKLKVPQNTSNNLLERIEQDFKTIIMFERASKSARRMDDQKGAMALSKSADHCLTELRRLSAKNADSIKQEVRIMEGHMMLRRNFHAGMNIITTDDQRKVITEALAHMYS